MTLSAISRGLSGLSLRSLAPRAGPTPRPLSLSPCPTVCGLPLRITASSKRNKKNKKHRSLSTSTAAVTPMGDNNDEIRGYAMPKTEIKALQFLEKHPSYDGRGTIIAIFDSGVDPGAAGLQVTTDGKQKVIDIIDCTGSGDVDTSTVRELDADGCIEGIYGKKLKPSASWANPSGKWHVGTKRVYDLITGSLKRRMKAERRKAWATEHRQATTAALDALATFDKKNPSPATTALKREREELKARLDLLQGLEEEEDLGPLLECVVWNDGEHWRTALEATDLPCHMPPVSGEGAVPTAELAAYTPLADFDVEYTFGTFSAMDACNFGVHVYDGGKVLSIVVDASPHGTHVAGIAAAHHPEDPAMDGCAPGAQVISCKIGDSRLGSMETGAGLTRALIAVIQKGADIINMSYGEATSLPDVGRFIDLANEVVHEHGVVFISSAGNDGPALSTIGAPAGTGSSIIAIGAWSSPLMAKSGHSVLEVPDEGIQYTWSSRGPTMDGALGVGLSAPGGAIAPVPQWTRERRMLMNGTSMASPNACGGIALLLSALKQQGAPRMPALVRRACEESARSLEIEGAEGADAAPLTFGRGLLQVDAAYEYLMKAAPFKEEDVRYEVTARRSGFPTGVRGLYLREPMEVLRAHEVSVNVVPRWKEGADVRSTAWPLEQFLDISAPVDWIKVPEHLMLCAGGRSFTAQVDPTRLPEGVHYAEIELRDPTDPTGGAVARVPVTVVKPALVPADGTVDWAPEMRWPNLKFSPGTIARKFVAVPEGATWAEVSIKAGALETPRIFMLHTVQCQPQKRYRDHETCLRLQLSAHKTFTDALPVVGGSTLEVALAQFWSSPSDTLMDLDVSFHGLTPSQEHVHVDGAAGAARVAVRSPFRLEKVAPSATLNAVCTPIRPTDAVLAPLPGPRDQWPDGRQIRGLVLTYKFKLEEGGKVTPLVPLFNGRVYDSTVEQQFYHITDANGKLVASGDIYPRDATAKLAKGEYTLKLMLRHDDSALLERARDLPLSIERALESAITVPVYTSVHAAASKGDTAREAVLGSGAATSYWVGAPPADKLPKDAAPGSTLTGKVVWGKLSPTCGGASKGCPGASTLSYSVPPKAKTKDEGDAKDADEPRKTGKERADEAVLAAKVKVLGELAKDSSDEAKSEYASLEGELLAAHPAHLPLLTLAMETVDDGGKEARKGRLGEVVKACERVVGAVDQVALAQFLARKCEADGPGAAKEKKEMGERRDALVGALKRKAAALLDMEAAAAEEEGSAAATGGGQEEDAFEASFEELRKWADTEDKDHALLHARRERRAGRPALALKALNKLAEAAPEKAGKDLAKLKAELMGDLGWTHCQLRQAQSDIEFPATDPLF